MGGIGMFEAREFDGVKGVLFDCYKTLIDIKTDENSIDTYRPVSSWLVYQGVKISPEELMREYASTCSSEMEMSSEPLLEIRVEEIFSQICRRHAIWEIDDVRVGIEAARAFRAASMRYFNAYPQSLKILNRLKDYPLALVSNGQRVFSEQELRYLDLEKYFRLVIFSSDLRYRKPGPRIFMEAARTLKLQPGELMYIGDSFENDIIPSIKLGMKAMHISEAWKFFDK